MKPLRSIVLIAALTGALGGCAWQQPQSEVTGNLYSRVNMELYPSLILAIDGSAPYYNPQTVSPGPHLLRVQGLAPNWEMAAKEFKVDFEPCKRYYIAASRVNPVTRDWEPVIDYAMPISGCPAGGSSSGGSTNRY